MRLLVGGFVLAMGVLVLLFSGLWAEKKGHNWRGFSLTVDRLVGALFVVGGILVLAGIVPVGGDS